MKKIFYFCFFICLVLLSGVAAAHQVVEIRPAFAGTTEGGLSNFHYLAQVQLETGLPNIPGNRLEAGKELPSYINYLFIFGLGAITILALARMMSGGIQYILAAGNVAKHEEAVNTIQQALLGMGLLLASYLLLKTINPDLVNLRNPNLTPASFTGQNWSPGQSVADWLKKQVGDSCIQGEVDVSDVSDGAWVCKEGKWIHFNVY